MLNIKKWLIWLIILIIILIGGKLTYNYFRSPPTQKERAVQEWKEVEKKLIEYHRQITQSNLSLWETYRIYQKIDQLKVLSGKENQAEIPIRIINLTNASKLQLAQVFQKLGEKVLSNENVISNFTDWQLDVFELVLIRAETELETGEQPLTPQQKSEVEQFLKNLKARVKKERKERKN